MICLVTWCRQQAGLFQRVLERIMGKGKFEKGRKKVNIFIKEQNVKMLRSEWVGGQPGHDSNSVRCLIPVCELAEDIQELKSPLANQPAIYGIFRHSMVMRSLGQAFSESYCLLCSPYITIQALQSSSRNLYLTANYCFSGANTTLFLTKKTACDVMQLLSVL